MTDARKIFSIVLLLSIFIEQPLEGMFLPRVTQKRILIAGIGGYMAYCIGISPLARTLITLFNPWRTLGEVRNVHVDVRANRQAIADAHSDVLGALGGIQEQRHEVQVMQNDVVANGRGIAATANAVLALNDSMNRVREQGLVSADAALFAGQLAIENGEALSQLSTEIKELERQFSELSNQLSIQQDKNARNLQTRLKKLERALAILVQHQNVNSTSLQRISADLNQLREAVQQQEQRRQKEQEQRENATLTRLSELHNQAQQEKQEMAMGFVSSLQDVKGEVHLLRDETKALHTEVKESAQQSKGLIERQLQALWAAVGETQKAMMGGKSGGQCDGSVDAAREYAHAPGAVEEAKVPELFGDRSGRARERKESKDEPADHEPQDEPLHPNQGLQRRDDGRNRPMTRREAAQHYTKMRRLGKKQHEKMRQLGDEQYEKMAELMQRPVKRESWLARSKRERRKVQEHLMTQFNAHSLPVFNHRVPRVAHHDVASDADLAQQSSMPSEQPRSESSLPSPQPGLQAHLSLEIPHLNRTLEQHASSEGNGLLLRPEVIRLSDDSEQQSPVPALVQRPQDIPELTSFSIAEQAAQQLAQGPSSAQHLQHPDRLRRPSMQHDNASEDSDSEDHNNPVPSLSRLFSLASSFDFTGR